MAPLWAGARSLLCSPEEQSRPPREQPQHGETAGLGGSLRLVEEDLGCCSLPLCHKRGGQPHQGLLRCAHAHTHHLNEGLLPSRRWTPASLCTPTCHCGHCSRPSLGWSSRCQSHVSPLLRTPSWRRGRCRSRALQGTALRRLQTAAGRAPRGSPLHRAFHRPAGWPQALALHRPVAARAGALLETNLCPLPALPQVCHLRPPAGTRVCRASSTLWSQHRSEAAKQRGPT